MPQKKISRKRAAPAAAAEAPKRLEISIDYPLEGDEVGGGHYAIRLTGERATETQVAINGEAWQECRGAVGFFWYDWWPQRAGVHQIEARARIGKGRWVKSGPRTCAVVLGSAA